VRFNNGSASGQCPLSARFVARSASPPVGTGFFLAVACPHADTARRGKDKKNNNNALRQEPASISRLYSERIYLSLPEKLQLRSLPKETAGADVQRLPSLPFNCKGSSEVKSRTLGRTATVWPPANLQGDRIATAQGQTNHSLGRQRRSKLDG